MRALTGLSVSLVLLLAACSQAPVAPAPPAATAPLQSLGTTTLTIGEGGAAQAVSSTVVTGISLTKGATTIYEDAFYRYLSTDYTVRNASATTRSNVTLMAIGTGSTLQRSPFKAFKLGDGSVIDGGNNATLAQKVATEIRPTHGAASAGIPDAAVNRASFQAYDEADVMALNGQSGITNAFPWGYVATKADGNRTLQPNETANLTLAARVPKNRDVTAFNLSVAVVTDDQIRTTRDLLERTTQGEAATSARGNALSAANGGAVVQVAVLPDDLSVTSCASCTVTTVTNTRVAGTSAAGSVRLLDPSFPRTQVTRTGLTAPGGGTFGNASTPSLNNAGQVAFYSGLTGGTGSQGLFTGTPGALSPLAQQGQSAPGAGSGTYNALNTSVTLNEAGQAAFLATLTGGTGTQGLFLGTPGAVSALALQGQSAPGVGGTTLNTFGTTVPLNSAGQAAFYATLTGSATATQGLFLGTPGAVSALAVRGQSAPGTGGATYNNFNSNVSLNNVGQMMFFSSLTGSATVTSGLFLGTPGAISSVALVGQGAPGSGGATFSGIATNAILNDAGQAAFYANLTGGTGTQGLFLGTPGAVSALALQGQSAPGTGGATYAGFNTQVALNGAGQTAFYASLTGGTAPNGLFMGTPGAVSPLALVGQSAPELPGRTISAVGTTPALSAAGAVFTVNLAGPGVTSANNQAVYFGTPGQLQLLVRKGDVLDVNPDPAVETLKRVNVFSYHNTLTGEENGRVRSLNSTGTLAVTLTFTDNTNSVYLVR